MNNSNKKAEVIILGAGISGLTLSYYLHKQKKNFLVFDSNKTIGGNIISKIKDGYVCENGPNTVLLNNSFMDNLISDLDLKKEIIYPNNNNNNRYLVKKGKLFKIPLSIMEFFRSNLLSLNSKIRIVFEVFIKKHDKNASVYHFIKKRFGKEFHDIIIEPFLTGVYAGNTRNMSAKHVLNKIWKIEQSFGSVILGFIRGKSEKKSMKSFNFKKGLSELTNSIYEKIEDNVKLNHKVTSIVKVDNIYEITINNQIKYSCNKLISTIPAFALSNISYDTSLNNILSSVYYCPIHVIHLSLEKDKINENINGFGVLTKPSDKTSFLGILFNSRIFPHVAPKGKDLITVMVGGSRQENLVQMDKDLVLSNILNDIKKLFSYKGKVLLINDYKWEKGIPQYSLKHEELVKGIKEFQNKNKNFYIIGNYINGISVSDCVKNAYLLSKKL